MITLKRATIISTQKLRKLVRTFVYKKMKHSNLEISPLLLPMFSSLVIILLVLVFSRAAVYGFGKKKFSAKI